MGRIAGHFEWDDDTLHPGQRSEGGLIDNLYSSDGKLQGRGRFIPAEDDELVPVVTEYVYVPAETRREQDESFGAQIGVMVGDLLAEALIAYTETTVRPAVQRWWQESARPRVAERASKVRRVPLVGRLVKHSPVDEVPQESTVLDAASVERARPKMSVSEAQARMLAAAAAHRFYLEQLHLVESSQIVGSEDVTDDSLAVTERALQKLPATAAEQVMTSLSRNPALLGEENLAQLASMMLELHRGEPD